MTLDFGWKQGYFKRLIFWPLLTFVLVVMSWHVLDQVFLKHIHDQRENAEQQAQQLQYLQKQVTELRRLQNVYRQYGQAYSNLNAQWLLAVDRVDWTDALTNAVDLWLAQGLNLKFDSEKQLTEADLAQLPIGAPIFYQNRINLSLRLQSDQDFFALIDYIRKTINPNIWLERCDIQRQDAAYIENPQLHPTRGNLTVDCQFSHFYIKPRSFETGEFMR